ncbi:MAG: hypothetical protein GXO39_01900 [Thermotogae bacterium]|nr:hypothetical protein [Thermotogota bacterium]
MSRWKQYQVAKQQRRKINAKLDKAFLKIRDLLAAGKYDDAKMLAQRFLMKYPTHMKSWRLIKLVDAWKEVIGDSFAQMKSHERRKVLRALTYEYKNNDFITPKTLKSRIDSSLRS